MPDRPEPKVHLRVNKGQWAACKRNTAFYEFTDDPMQTTCQDCKKAPEWHWHPEILAHVIRMMGRGPLRYSSEGNIMAE
jgi:hypothetical protein